MARATVAELAAAAPGGAPPGDVSDLLERLDAEQRAAALLPDGPAQIIGPAGSGKTTTLIARLGVLLARGVAADRICVATFNRDAAADLVTRIGARLRPLVPSAAEIEVRTLHALARQVLLDAGGPGALGAGHLSLGLEDRTTGASAGSRSGAGRVRITARRTRQPRLRRSGRARRLVYSTRMRRCETAGSAASRMSWWTSSRTSTPRCCGSSTFSRRPRTTSLSFVMMTSRSSELAHTAGIFASEVAREATTLLPPGGRGLLYYR